jgi:hypothetical protein
MDIDDRGTRLSLGASNIARSESLLSDSVARRFPVCRSYRPWIRTFQLQITMVHHRGSVRQWLHWGIGVREPLCRNQSPSWSVSNRGAGSCSLWTLDRAHSNSKVFMTARGIDNYVMQHGDMDTKLQLNSTPDIVGRSRMRSDDDSIQSFQIWSEFDICRLPFLLNRFDMRASAVSTHRQMLPMTSH